MQLSTDGLLQRPSSLFNAPDTAGSLRSGRRWICLHWRGALRGKNAEWGMWEHQHRMPHDDQLGSSFIYCGSLRNKFKTSIYGHYHVQLHEQKKRQWPEQYVLLTPRVVCMMWDSETGIRQIWKEDPEVTEKLAFVALAENGIMRY